MRVVKTERHERIIINPGEFYVSSNSVIISTLLGSCVSACLYDPIQNIIGMNHFLLSNKRYARNMPFPITEAGRYGIHAMELLINGMFKLGAKRQNLRAKAFGGASLLQLTGTSDNFFCVGEVNARFIREFLKNEGIPLVSEDLEGDTGRIIRFYFDNFSVYVKKIPKTVSPELVSKEKRFWQKNIEEQEQKIAEPDIWLS